MKIKHLAIGIFTATMLYSCGGGATETTTEETTEATEVTEGTVTGEAYTVDLAASTIGWYGDKAIVEGQHNGAVQLKSASLLVNEGAVVGGEFIVDMTTITCEDLTDPELNAKLVGHLKSGDFFLVDSFPEAKFVITGVSEGNVTGNLTIRGVTKSESFPAEIVVAEDGTVSANATIEIDRTKYDIKYGSKNFFADLVDEYVISDKIKITVALTAAK